MNRIRWAIPCLYSMFVQTILVCGRSRNGITNSEVHYSMSGIIYILCRSVVEIWRYMSQFTGVKVLLGDMNAEPHSAPIRQVE